MNHFTENTHNDVLDLAVIHAKPCPATNFLNKLVNIFRRGYPLFSGKNTLSNQLGARNTERLSLFSQTLQVLLRERNFYFPHSQRSSL